MQAQPGFGVWTYRPDVTSGSKIVDYTVEAIDGRIGKIDAASDEADAAHLVVDVGFWIFGKKRLIPAGVVAGVDSTKHSVFVNMTKEQVKNAPDWEQQPSGASWRGRYDEYYGPFGS